MTWKKLKVPGVPCEINEYGQIREKITVKSGQIVRNRVVPLGRSGPNRQWAFTRVVNGKQKTYLAHFLVARTFLPNPHKYRYLKFKNGKVDDIRACNLEWAPSWR